MSIRIATAMIAVLLVTACDFALPGDAGELQGEWRLVDGVHEGGPVPIPDDAPITMTVDGDEIGGHAACNIYGGELTVDGDRLAIGAMTMTEMGCDVPIMEAEAAYVAALGDVERWGRDGETLTLSGDAVELAYEAVQPRPDEDLVGTSWRLETLVDGEVASSTIGDEPARLELHDDGTLSGTTGCRTFDGRYELENGTVAVTDLVNDDRACPDLAMQDEHLLAVIAGGFAFRVEGGRLTLTDGPLGLVYVAGEGARTTQAGTGSRLPLSLSAPSATV